MKRFLFISLLVMICSAFFVPEKLSKKADKVITKFYGTEEFSKEVIVVSEPLNSGTASEFGDGNLFKIKSADNLLGYGYIGSAFGKAANFDYLVLFDTNFIITKSKVLVYREEYGGEIGSKRWLKQFNGKSTVSSELKYIRDIIPISGATISVRSMTKAINDLLQSIRKLQELNAL